MSQKYKILFTCLSAALTVFLSFFGKSNAIRTAIVSGLYYSDAIISERSHQHEVLRLLVVRIEEENFFRNNIANSEVENHKETRGLRFSYQAYRRFLREAVALCPSSIFIDIRFESESSDENNFADFPDAFQSLPSLSEIHHCPQPPQVFLPEPMFTVSRDSVKAEYVSIPILDLDEVYLKKKEHYSTAAFAIAQHFCSQLRDRESTIGPEKVGMGCRSFQEQFGSAVSPEGISLRWYYLPSIWQPPDQTSSCDRGGWSRLPAAILGMPQYQKDDCPPIPTVS